MFSKDWRLSTTNLISHACLTGDSLTIDELYLGYSTQANNGANGTFNMSGGFADIDNLEFTINNSSNGRGLVNMSGGYLRLTDIFVRNGFMDGFNWTGGTIEFVGDSASTVELVNGQSTTSETFTNSSELIVEDGAISTLAFAAFSDTITTNYEQTASGVLKMEIDHAANESDLITLTSGVMTLDGELELSYITPPVGSGFRSYTIVDGPYVGTFDTGNAEALGLSLEYNTNSVVVVRNDLPVVNADATTKTFVLEPLQTDVEVDLLGGVSDSYPTSGALSTTWTLASNPGGVVTFADAGALNTTATLAGVSTGTFVFRQTAADALGLVSSATVSVTISGSDNLAPVVSTGPDRVVPGGTATTFSLQLVGMVIDPENAPVSGVWSVVSPTDAGVYFNPPSALITEVVLPSEPGVYVLKLTGADGAFSPEDNVTITVIQLDPTSTRGDWELYR